MNPETQRPTTPQEVHETLYDGCDCAITYRDGRAGSVKVRRIPRDEFAQYAGLMDGDEAAECAFYVAGRDAAWAESLSDESYDQVLEEGQRLNFSRLASWFLRQTRRIELAKGNKAVMDKTLEIMKESPELRKLLGSMNGS